MRTVFLVTGENKVKAENILRKDDVVARQSIAYRQCLSLGVKEDGFFIIIDGADNAIQKARELLKDLATEYKNKDAVLKAYDEQEEQASEGFGFIMK